jgi:hypothetical protein
MNNWKSLAFSFLLFSIFANAQIDSLEKIESLHAIGSYAEARQLVMRIDTSGFDNLQQSRCLREQAISNINTTGDLIGGYRLLLKAKQLEANQDPDLRFWINDELIYTQLSINEKKYSAKELQAENCVIALETKDPEQLINCNTYQIFDLDPRNSEYYRNQLALLHKSRNIAINSSLMVQKGNIELNIATIHERNKNYDSTLYYLKKLKGFVEKKNYQPTTIAYYLNLGSAYRFLEQYELAIEHLEKALKLSNSTSLKPHKSKILINLASTTFTYNQYKKSSYYYQELQSLTDSLSNSERLGIVQELEAKYQVQEGKLENAELSADNERQKVTIISIAGSALTLLLIGIFVYKNQDKKRRLAKQEMELEKQRADNLMKNQELATIDAMIAGQEKERKKLAEDLHDDLGSSLTTIRLYFDNLKDHFKPGTSSEIYNRTDKLLEDTYATIRNMSHSRHNGVLASEGLIPSLQTLAENITNSGKIKVNIFHHGMDRKLENSLELNIFRMLQELLSNVVKHAGATEASINIVGSKNTIDLMVEDNGSGFVSGSSKKSSGMGLYSIETRVEEMDGTFDIDSNSGHGTTITIEIPTL